MKTARLAQRFAGACLQAMGRRHRLQAGSYLLLATCALAQQGRPAPHIGYIFPAGAQQGTTVTVSIGGQNLNGTSAAFINGVGLEAKVTGFERPLNGKESQEMRDEVQKLQDKRAAARADAKNPPFTNADEMRVTEIRDQLAKRANRQGNPVIAETVTLQITLAPDAPPGERELRLKTPGGLSNPMTFCVGQLPEFSEKVVTATSEPIGPNTAQILRAGRPRTDMEIKLPATVNGQILPGEVDRFHFDARKGQRLVIAVSARALIPYLADAVPGWFQATLALFDAKGRELAYDDDFRFNPDPVLCYDIPADGTYTIEVKDSIFRGREDFVYRIAIGELPFVTGIFPLGATVGTRATFDVTGWNLPAPKLAMDTQDKSPGTFLISVRGNGQLSNPARIALDSQADVLEAEPNDRPELAQPLVPPAIVNGRIGRPGDEDVFRFEGKAGSEIVAEVFARRLGSPLDSTLKLTDAAGKQLAFNDDYDDKAAGLLTHQADSRLSAKLPTDGTYFLTLADAQRQGGADYSYRLHVGPPQPDFDLRVVPASVNLRAGGSVPLTVYALRHDGFSGDIALRLRDAPWGFGLSGARIPAGQDKVQVTLTAPFGSNDEMASLTVIGVAKIAGKDVARAAAPAEDMMQAFAYRHLVPARELKADVAGRGAPFRVVTAGPVRLTAGGTARVRIASPASRAVGKVHFELSEPPPGVTIQEATIAGDNIDVTLACDAAQAKAGQSGNLLFNAFGERNNPNAPKNAPRAARVPLGAVPAIPFEIVAPAGAATPAGKVTSVP